MVDSNSASSIAKIFDIDNREVKLKYRHQSSNYLESIIYYDIAIMSLKLNIKIV